MSFRLRQLDGFRYLFATEDLECKDRQTVNIYINPFETPTVTAG